MAKITSNLAKMAYSKSSFADKGKRPKVIISFIIIVIFVLLVAFIFSAYNFGAYIPGVSNAFDNIPLLSHLDRSPQNVLPKVSSAETGINAYHFTADFALQSTGNTSSSGNINQSFAGNISFANPKNVLLASSLSEKITSSQSALAILGNVKEVNSKMYINFSKFPSVLNSGVKLNQWIELPQVQFTFLSDLAKQTNVNYSTISTKFVKNEMLNGTLVSEYTLMFPKKDFTKINLSPALDTLSGISSMGNIISSKNIMVNEYIGVANNKIYQESVRFSVVDKAPTLLYFGITMNSFNKPVTVVTPKSFTSVSGKSSSSSSKSPSSTKKTTTKK
ncbi:hypothetical protein M1145_02860 [Patescibacteria group bacterium]|nr:hypothetical protein [Patescibacteria group bacterium]